MGADNTYEEEHFNPDRHGEIPEDSKMYSVYRCGTCKHLTVRRSHNVRIKSYCERAGKESWLYKVKEETK